MQIMRASVTRPNRYLDARLWMEGRGISGGWEDTCNYIPETIDVRRHMPVVQ